VVPVAVMPDENCAIRRRAAASGASHCSRLLREALTRRSESRSADRLMLSLGQAVVMEDIVS